MNTLPTILIIDDEIRCLATLRLVLEDDCDLNIASDTVEAERRLQLREEWIQVILCDQRQPGDYQHQFSLAGTKRKKLADHVIVVDNCATFDYMMRHMGCLGTQAQVQRIVYSLDPCTVH